MAYWAGGRLFGREADSMEAELDVLDLIHQYKTPQAMVDAYNAREIPLDLVLELFQESFVEYSIELGVLRLGE
jgi:hypothetical protein